uniref:Small ribosomal subunit protein uS2 n=1 Tax=Paramoeba aestuarina TaxID=180227 RepID=A0A6U3D8R6_9EUKA|eukprot:CAMPEP_0201507388 /NCGR_PEP_ID=MMETSP0161_2-20130828/1055_1 /ASSEMBLY_ACC=CAM_ASM_000251 /TAXON_ID=180227 /ORGANISM="Neoparamoeba aestuarina, Strain SoJaBio B1-5/56/2" /LENGTH=279 /DNA_ID=CAMNT_0047901733 /DNA_START=53 /DNA_END=892 /DNA_ORIENTATION=-
MAQYPAAMHPSEEDMKMMLACQVHVGSTNLDPNMERYVWDRRKTDGRYIINLQKTWEKLMFAARVIVAVDKPQDVAVISAREYGQRAVLKFSHFAGIRAISGRFTPGTFTNQIQRKFMEPRLLVVTDAYADGQALIEASYVNLPTIAFVDTDQSVKNVDVVIPCGNKGKHSIGLLYWMLCREVLRLRGAISREEPWDVMVDLFFFRDPDAVEEQEAEAEAVAPPTLNWGEQPQAQNWGDAAPEEGSAPAEGQQVDVAQPPAGQQWDNGLSNVASAWQQE